MEYLSKLPDDVIKYVESFVDKRPPFADELLKYDFTTYSLIIYHRESDDGYLSDDEIFHSKSDYNIDLDRFINFKGDQFMHSLWTDNGSEINECSFGRNIVYWDSKYYSNALGLIMKKNPDDDIPPQTFNCGV